MVLTMTDFSSVSDVTIILYFCLLQISPRFSVPQFIWNKHSPLLCQTPRFCGSISLFLVNNPKLEEPCFQALYKDRDTRQR